MMPIRSLVLQLFDLGAVQFGSFVLKSNITSPFYIDLRLTLSSPKLLIAIADALHHLIKGISSDLLCGVPYTALPFATAISIRHNIPLLLRRKEKKEYGTGKLIEGIYSKGQCCVIVEDVITSGKSILETAEPLQELGLIVKDALVLVDREQGGKSNLQARGIHLHTVLTISMIVGILQEEQFIEPSQADSVIDFVRSHRPSCN